MKNILAMIMPCILCCSLYATQQSPPKLSEPFLWKSLYDANFSLSHKLILSRKTESTNDEILSQFMMSYLYYREGKYDEMMNCLEGINTYIEYHYKVNKNEITK
jgi:hypothetical protein